MKKVINKINKLIFLLTKVLFSLIPITMILGGGIAIMGILLSWYYARHIILSEIWYILLSLLMIAIGFKWDDVAKEK